MSALCMQLGRRSCAIGRQSVAPSVRPTQQQHARRRTCLGALAQQTTATISASAVTESLASSASPAAASEGLMHAVHAEHAERLLYQLADAAAVIDSDTATAVAKRAGGWFQPLADGLQTVLEFLQSGLNAAHVPYSYGFSIILLTMLVKVATYPFTKQQVESALAVQSLKPRVDLIKKRYGEDKDKISKETNLLYEQAGVNPLAGCLPTLATIPIFIGLFSSLSNASSDGLFDTEGFFWIPSLAGPTTIAARQSGTGTEWLYPFVDGAPSIGWDEASRYLVLPVLLVASQYLSNAILAVPLEKDDPNRNTTVALQTFLPLMIGWFSLNVPSGLTLYYFANSVLTTLIQIYLKKLGGANVVVNDLGPVTKPGSGRRTGEPVAYMPWVPTTVKIGPQPEAEEGAESSGAEGAGASVSAYDKAPEAAPMLDPATVSRRVKRRRMALILQQQQQQQKAGHVLLAEGDGGAAGAAAANGAAA